MSETRGKVERDLIFDIMDFVVRRTDVPVQPDLQVAWCRLVERAVAVGWRPPERGIEHE